MEDVREYPKKHLGKNIEKELERSMEKGQLTIPCSRCNGQFTMAQLRSPPTGDSLVCLACLSGKKKKERVDLAKLDVDTIPPPPGGKAMPGSLVSPESSQMSMPKSMTIEEYEKQEKERKQANEKVQLKKNLLQEFKCMNCGYSLKKRQIPTRCPYCGKTSMHKQVGLIRDIDVIGRY